MSLKQQQLKALTTQSKEIAEQKKRLREELQKTKEERRKLVSSVASGKKKMREANTNLRNLIGQCNKVAKEKDIEKIDDLAGAIETTAEDVVKHMRQVSESLTRLNEL